MDTDTDTGRSTGAFRFYKVTISLLLAGGFAQGALMAAVDGDNSLAALKILWFLAFYVFGVRNVFSLLEDAEGVGE